MTENHVRERDFDGSEQVFFNQTEKNLPHKDSWILENQAI